MTQQKGPPSGKERRRSRRRPILETFSVFMVIPKKGIHQLDIHDLSEIGMGFDLDLEGEDSSTYVVNPGDIIDFQFYINRSLYIPLSIRVVRIENQGRKRRVGAEFQDKASESYQAFLAFVQVLDRISNVIQMTP